MKKGAVFIGCGFAPTALDAQNAIRQGYVKHCNVISTLGFTAPVHIELALTAYIRIARQKDWTVLEGLQVAQIPAGDGRLIWCVYPVA